MCSYERVEAPITTEIIEAVVWMICCARTDLYSSSLEVDVFSTLLQHLLSVLGSGRGLDDPDTVHAFCQLLDRFKVGDGMACERQIISNIRMLNDAAFRRLISLATAFTTTLVNSIYDSTNSLSYLFHFWYRLCQDVGRLLSEIYIPLNEFLETQLLQILQTYTAKRIGDVDDWLDSADDDPLVAIDASNLELTFLGGMIRFQYDKGLKLLSDLYDGVNKEYAVRDGVWR